MASRAGPQTPPPIEPPHRNIPSADEPLLSPPAKARRDWSIRWVLSGWYIGSLILILVVFSATLYVMVSTSSLKHVDRQLLLEANGVTDALFAFWRAERASALASPGNWQDAPPATFRSMSDMGQLPETIRRWAEKTGRLTAGSTTRFLTTAGQPVVPVPGFDAPQLQVSDNLLQRAVAGELIYQTVRLPQRRVRVMIIPVGEERRTVYLLQGVAGLDTIDAPLARLRWGLLLLVPLTVFGTGAVGWMVAAQAMRPVDRMTTQARRITVSRLHQRIEVPQSRDELERLGRTFNAMLDRLEGGFKRMRQFSAAASHELRTPLTIMRGELEVALRQPRSPEEYQRVLRTTLEAIREMTAVIEELLALARTGAVGGAIEWRAVDLGELVTTAGQTWQSVAQTKTLQLEIAAERSVIVRGEGRLLERVMANLIDNAMRHTPPRGRIALSVTRTEDRAVFRVADTGPGIPQGELPQVFDRFFKPREEERPAGSTGLGLGLCRWIVEAHHGHIDVLSPPGGGTTVTVSLPLV